MNGSRLKFLAIGKIGLVPSVHPNPRVLGEAWSSYGRAKPTQNNPRNKNGEVARKKTAQEPAEEIARYDSPVDPTH